MTTVQFLSYLHSLDVRLWIESDRLRYNAPSGVITPALRAELVKRKEAIIAFLRGVQSSLHSSSQPILPVSRKGNIPLSFAQQGLWFLDQLVPGNPAYNIPHAMHLMGALNIAALMRTLNEIVGRHEILRTTFAAVEGRPIQVITPTLMIPLPVVDLSLLPEGNREIQTRRLVAVEAWFPFDLQRGPLLRSTLFRLDVEEHILLLTMHHIVCDGWSIGILNRELAVLYQAFTTGQSSPLPALPIQYADFSVWQREWLEGAVLEEQLSYWRKQLAGMPEVLELPTNLPRPPMPTFRGASQQFMLSKSLTEKLKILSEVEGVTLFMLLLAAFDVLLYRYTGQEDVVVGSPAANRNRVEIEGLIGFFVNTLVLRMNLSGNPTFREFLRQVWEVTLEGYAHQDLPFEMLVEKLEPQRDLNRHPLFQVMLIFQNAQNTPMESLELQGLRLNPLDVGNQTAKFDLTLSMMEIEQGLGGVVECNTDVLDTATMVRMLRHFQTLLEGIVVDPQQRLSELPLLTEVEQQQLLMEWT